MRKTIRKTKGEKKADRALEVTSYQNGEEKTRKEFLRNLDKEKGWGKRT